MDKRTALEARIWDEVRLIPNTRTVISVALDLALEEAAKLSESMNSHGVFIAAAIRALKGDTNER